MARQTSPKNMTTKQAHDRAWWPLILFFFFLILLASAFLIYRYYHVQQKYTSVNSMVFSSYTGPVSPQFQATQTLTITPTTCQYQVLAFDAKLSKTETCTVNTATFAKIIDSYYSNNIPTKIEYNNNDGGQTAIGGPTKMMVINLSDGSQLKTTVDSDFSTNAQNFYSTVTQYIPKFKELGY